MDNGGVKNVAERPELFLQWLPPRSCRILSCDHRPEQGTFFYADGSRHIGQWVNNRKHGAAVFVSDSGRTFEGAFDNDVMLGKLGQVRQNCAVSISMCSRGCTKKCTASSSSRLTIFEGNPVRQNYRVSISMCLRGCTKKCTASSSPQLTTYEYNRFFLLPSGTMVKFMQQTAVSIDSL